MKPYFSWTLSPYLSIMVLYYFMFCTKKNVGTPSFICFASVQPCWENVNHVPVRAAAGSMLVVWNLTATPKNNPSDRQPLRMTWQKFFAMLLPHSMLIWPAAQLRKRLFTGRMSRCFHCPSLWWVLLLVILFHFIGKCYLLLAPEETGIMVLNMLTISQKYFVTLVTTQCATLKKTTQAKLNYEKPHGNFVN